MDSLENSCIEELLRHDSVKSSKPMTASEILTVGSRALGPLFQGPPLGPIPEYLQPHFSVHACAAGYEDQFDELDHWKAIRLQLWLQSKKGAKWSVGGITYELQAEKDDAAAIEKFRFRLTENNFDEKEDSWPG